MPKIQFTKGNVAYAGSLTPVVAFEESKNIDEKKGFLLWDTDALTNRFVAVDNPYRYVTLHVNSISELDTICEGGNYDKLTSFRITVPDHVDSAQKNEISSYLIQKYTSETKPRVQNIANTENLRDAIIDSNATYDIADYDVQIEFLNRWLKLNNHGSDCEIACDTFHKEIFSVLDVVNKTIGDWYPESMSWSNFGPYGLDNSIDFSTLNGLIGVFSPNLYGKSTLSDVLVYSIFGKPRKNIGLGDFINTLEQKASSSITLSHNGNKYRVIRNVERKKGGTSAKLSFEILANGEWCNLDEHDSNQTKNAIQNIFGERQDLLYTAISGRLTTQGIIGSGSAERLKSLYRFLNLDVFTRFNEKSKDSIKDVEAEIRILERSASQDEYQRVVSEVATLQQSIDKLSDNLESSLSNKAGLEIRRNDLKIELQGLNSNLSDFVNLTGEKSGLERDVRTINAKLEPELNLFEINTKKLSDFIEKLKKFNTDDIDKLKTSMDDFGEFSLKRSQLETKKSSISEKKKRTTVDLAILNKHDWFETSDICKKCDFLKNAWSAKDEVKSIDETLAMFESLLIEIDERIKATGLTRTDVDSLRVYVKAIESLKHELQTQKLTIAELNNSLNSKTSRLELINQNIEKLSDKTEEFKKVEQYQNEIVKLTSELDAAERAHLLLEKEFFTQKSQKSQKDGTLSSIEAAIKKLTTLYEALKHHRVYQQAMSKSGIPLMIIESMLPVINFEINRILENQPYTIEIRIDSDDLNIYLINGDTARDIESVSDSQMVIISIALRVALLRSAQIARPNFLIIDEGFDALDADSIITIAQFIEDIKRHFKFVIIISHAAQMHDIVDHKLLINRDNDRSVCVYPM